MAVGKVKRKREKSFHKREVPKKGQKKLKMTSLKNGLIKPKNSVDGRKIKKTSKNRIFCSKKVLTKVMWHDIIYELSARQRVTRVQKPDV